MRNARLLGADAQPERKGGPARLVWRARRHVAWVRAHGLGRVVEEDGLHPLQRAARALDRRRWRRANGVAPGAAVPVFLVGLQRSGTNMIVRGLERSPEFEVHNENDRRAFDRFRLRSDSTVRGLIASSRHRYVLLKPLCDSHRVPDLLELAGRPGTGRAIWAYRGVEGTARSALAKFGDLRGVLAEIAAGGGRERWHAQRLSEASLDLLTSFDYREMTPASSAALFWLIRNSLYFELGLERRGDVMAVSYESLLADPESTTRRLCEFLGLAYHPRFVAHMAVRGRPAGIAPDLDLDPEILARCRELERRLDEAAGSNRGRAGPPPGPIPRAAVADRR